MKILDRLLTSSKWQAALAAVMTAWAGVLTGDLLRKEAIIATITAILAALAGQSAADWGKEAKPPGAGPQAPPGAP